jgi:hypothetical protein
MTKRPLARGFCPNGDGVAQPEWLAKRVQYWSLAVLRFAVTLEKPEKQSILMMAAEMDQLGSWQNHSPFTFFVRTSIELCRAIEDTKDPNRTAVLSRYFNWIEHRRLKQAMAGAVDWERFSESVDVAS